ncbi:MAG: hypothetical protein M3546_11805 [Actinomycetota bacterium]|nr:hypothetical protein [Actinomycetota bacterium]
MADDDAGTSAVRCKIGGSTSTVDSTQTCTDLGGTVVPPPKPSKGTSCRQAIGPAAGGFGYVDYDMVLIAETFMDEVLKQSKSGRRFLKALMFVDRFVLDAVRKNPALMGEVVLAWSTCIGFVGARDLPRGKTARFSESAYRRMSRLGVRLRKSSKNARFDDEIDFLKVEFKSWVNRSPEEIKRKYLEL